MPHNRESTVDQAIAWHLRSPTMGEDDWRAFVAWLEESPENRSEYDQIAAVDGLLGCLPANRSLEAVALPPSSRFGSGRTVWAASAAALLIAGIGGYLWTRPQAASQYEQTAAGTLTSITNADGSRIDINGDTRLAIDGANPRHAVLEKGEALFAVRHGEQPYVVEAGGFEIRDLGTVFNVLVTDQALEVSVREGRVLFDPEGARVSLGANEMVTVDRGRNLVVKRPAASVGSWLGGDLSFEDARLADVVEAMHRRTGITIRLSPALSNSHFTGNIRLTGDKNADAVHLARLIGVDCHREGASWIFSADGKPR